jgi:transcriptional regulator with XRE-family HTH domain
LQGGRIALTVTVGASLLTASESGAIFYPLGGAFLMATKNENAIDRHVGARIRMQRIVRDMSQTELGNAVGISFQQVQKYEKGTNRVSASRLQRIANVLEVTPDFFFEEAQAKKAVGNSGSKEVAIIDQFISSRNGVALLRAFTRIRDVKTRRSIVSLVKQIAQV